MKHRLMVAAALAASCAFSAQAFAAADPVQERQAIFKEYKKTFGDGPHVRRRLGGIALGDGRQSSVQDD